MIDINKKQTAKEVRAENIARRKNDEFHAMQNEIMNRIKAIEKTQDSQAKKETPV